MDGTLAVITTWAADFAPRNWAYCNGQLLSIAQNSALFSLLGTTYGGNGIQTFGLPDLRSRTVVGAGQGQSYYALGENGGTESIALTINNIPPHTHSGSIALSMLGNATDATGESPSGTYPGNLANAYASTPDAVMASPTYAVNIGIVGSGTPFNNLSPYLVVNYVICLYGIYPSRN